MRHLHLPDNMKALFWDSPASFMSNPPTCGFDSLFLLSTLPLKYLSVRTSQMPLTQRLVLSGVSYCTSIIITICICINFGRFKAKYGVSQSVPYSTKWCSSTTWGQPLLGSIWEMAFSGVLRPNVGCVSLIKGFPMRRLRESWLHKTVGQKWRRSMRTVQSRVSRLWWALIV